VTKLLMAPGFQTSVIALATFRAPSVKKRESLRKRKKSRRFGGRRWEQNGSYCENI